MPELDSFLLAEVLKCNLLSLVISGEYYGQKENLRQRTFSLDYEILLWAWCIQGICAWLCG